MRFRHGRRVKAPRHTHFYPTYRVTLLYRFVTGLSQTGQTRERGRCLLSASSLRSRRNNVRGNRPLREIFTSESIRVAFSTFIQKLRSLRSFIGYLLLWSNVFSSFSIYRVLQI